MTWIGQPLFYLICNSGNKWYICSMKLMADVILQIDSIRKEISRNKRKLNKAIIDCNKDEIMEITVTIVALLTVIDNLNKELNDIFICGFPDQIKRLMN